MVRAKGEGGRLLLPGCANRGRKIALRKLAVPTSWKAEIQLKPAACQLKASRKSRLHDESHLERLPVEEAHLALYPRRQAAVHLLRRDVTLGAGAVVSFLISVFERGLLPQKLHTSSCLLQYACVYCTGARIPLPITHLARVREHEVVAPHVTNHALAQKPYPLLPQLPRTWLASVSARL